MSRTLLERKFKNALGITPHNHIQKIRLQKAKTLLSNTQLSVKEIAERCGFAHVEYLSVAFKREIGQTPTEYRSSHTTAY